MLDPQGLAAFAAKVSLRTCVALMSLFAVQSAFAQTAVEIPQEYSKLIKSAEAVGALGSDLFGEQTNFYTGATSFYATDTSIPGNDRLAVAVGRSYQVGFRGDATLQSLGLFGDWELDIPYLSGVFASRTGWVVTSATPTKRCSVSADQMAPPEIFVNDGFANTSISPDEYWSGNSLHLPGGGGGLMLSNWRPSSGLPSNPTTYKFTTAGNWLFSCLSSTAPGNNQPGEAFLGIAPDGTKYRFDWLVSRSYPAIAKARDSSGTGTRVGNPGAKQSGEITPTIAASGGVQMGRYEVRMMPTLVTDRFGNWVKYTWDTTKPQRLNAIDASDGRRITFTYNTAGFISSVSAGLKKWTYTYSTSGSLLSVKLPDGNAWTIDFAGWNSITQYIGSAGPCAEPATQTISSSSAGLIGTITHPSGAKGQFGMASVVTGRSYVPKRCTNPQTGYIVIPSKTAGVALATKTISGPGMVTESWTHNYGAPNNSFAQDCTTTSCSTTRTVSVTGPGEFTRYTFGNKYQDTEGKLLKVEHGASESQILSTETTTYQFNPSGQAYPASIGFNPNDRMDINEVKYTPVIQRTLVQDGVTFKYTASSFNAFAEPVVEVRASTGGAGGSFSRTQTLGYYQDLNRWVLNRVSTVTDGGGKVASRVDFDAATSQPVRSYAFDVLQQTYRFNTDGTLAGVKDGRGNETTFASWYRGVPRSVSYPNLEGESAVVNDDGTIASSTDELGSVTAYGYDSMGRLNKITYPTGDTRAWALTTRDFSRVATVEYGIAAGHWKQVLQTGNGRTSTFYDAQWRPVLTLVEDTTTAASRSYTVKRYDGAGREVFSSYPVKTLTSVADATLKGVTTEYDGLGRVKKSSQYSELGTLVTTTDYLPGLQVKVTNPRNFSTTTSFQLFDKPSTDAPVRISLPEGVTTAIDRDSFGKPRSITRSGGSGASAVSETRSYVYDANERLCKTLNPESGATIVNYDDSGNIAWSADGLSLTSAVCDRASVTDDLKTTRTYDKLNRLLSVATPLGKADVVTTYERDGAVATVSAANPDGGAVVTTYSYNKRRLLTREAQANGQVLYAVDYGYNANGHLESMTYPDAEQVTYAPDALGRPTQVTGTSAVYASGVTYFPNGAISGFQYGPQGGGGPVHTMMQNERLLPKRSQDMLGATAILDDEYSYDKNGNVLDIYDRAQQIDRAMGYDGLDRLTNANADNLLTTTAYDALWGVGTYSYDALDNLRSADQGTRKFRYEYDVNWRLQNIKDPVGAVIYTFGYDAQGNTISKGTQTFAFDSSNRMNSAMVLSGAGSQVYRYDGLGRRVQTTDPDSKATYWLYTQAGQVLYSAEARRRRNISYIYLGGSQIATRAWDWDSGATSIRYQMTDALGSPSVDTSTAGAGINRTSYTPWGEASPSRDGAGYTGHVMDADTGLIYMQQRFYDASTGAFIQIDPEVVNSKTAWNSCRYCYGANNPYKFKDPDGRIIDTIADVAFIVADVAEISSSGLTVTNGLALTADVVGAVIPGATGLGAGVRGISKAATAFRGSKLARSMAAAGTRVKKGIEEAHHIVAKLDQRADAARKILGRNGIGIHSAENGAAMAKGEHRGVHTTAYHEEVVDRLQRAESRGTDSASRAAEVRCELACMRQELETKGRLGQ